MHFQYSLCRVVLMVSLLSSYWIAALPLSVLALSSRFDGQGEEDGFGFGCSFQYSLCRVVLMVSSLDL